MPLRNALDSLISSMLMPSVILPILWILEAPLPHAQLQLLCSGLLYQQTGKILALIVPAQQREYIVLHNHIAAQLGYVGRTAQGANLHAPYL